MIYRELCNPNARGPFVATKYCEDHSGSEHGNLEDHLAFWMSGLIADARELSHNFASQYFPSDNRRNIHM